MSGVLERARYAAAWPWYTLGGLMVTDMRYHGTGNFTVLDETVPAYQRGRLAATIEWYAFSGYLLLALGVEIVSSPVMWGNSETVSLPGLLAPLALLVLAWLSLNTGVEVTKEVPA